MIDENQDTLDSGNWDDRVLCQDESCTGTIGSDGRCRECGLPLDKESVVAASSAEENQASMQLSTEDDIADDMPVDLDQESGDDDTDTTPAWDDRILCRDESCIGTIGPDGCCSICGLSLEADGDAEDG